VLLEPPPADLTDNAWVHGGTDGEVFTTIRDGAKNTGMKGFGGRLTTQEIWQLVNYVRSLGQRRAITTE
jgi:mono/diheme cytochrome c family protein